MAAIASTDFWTVDETMLPRQRYRVLHYGCLFFGTGSETMDEGLDFTFNERTNLDYRFSAAGSTVAALRVT